MPNVKQIIFYVEFDASGKAIKDIKIQRDTDDEQTILTFATLYARSKSFARIMQSFTRTIDSIKANTKMSQQFFDLLKNVTIIE